MSRTLGLFTTEYKFEAAHRVIDSGRTIADVARELDVNEGLVGRWVASYNGRAFPTKADPLQQLTNGCISTAIRRVIQ
jgi:transposase